ncbi:MAG: dehydrogenase [Vicinamibacterales bacterium]
MKRIVSISLGSSETDYEFTTPFLGERFHIRRLGCDWNVDRAEALLDRCQHEADAVGLGLVRGHATVGARHYPDHLTRRLERVVSHAPFTTGAALQDFFDEWAVRHVQSDQPEYFTNAHVLFLSGLAQYRAAAVLSEFTRNLRFADPATLDGLPFVLGSLRALEFYALATARMRSRPPPGESRTLRPWTRTVLHRSLDWAHVLVGAHQEIERLNGHRLRDRVILTSSITDDVVARFAAGGVAAVIDRTPKLLERVVGLNVLDAMILALLDKPAGAVLHDDYLHVLGGLDFSPRVLYPGGRYRRITRFAFVIHPLSQEYFKAVKPVAMLSRAAGRRGMNLFEKAIAYSPPFVYSHVKGIESPEGVAAEGWLISVGGTPRQLLAHSPEFTYRRLLKAARKAEKLGAQIMGLGAFTKVVGDAGVTVARRATLPITTGNSYSASAALWAGADAARRLGFVSFDRNGRVRGKAMVVGATGAIGSACARLLAQAVEEVYLVSIESAKLLTLKESILKDTPEAALHVAAHPDPFLSQMDMIVTATSGAGKKVLDIMKVKPGCVITDVARPLDLPPEEVARRPDVLVIESGEILLPGTVSMKDIGLPCNIAYACLAETIVLALEGRFETFTIGRHIEWRKVKEIYKLGLKHGMRLAAISGVNGVFSDDDIARVRERAQRARNEGPFVAARAAVPSPATARVNDATSASTASP